MEQMQPKVSVVIPAYNAEPFIRQTIQSVLGQTYQGQIEILVIDDHSQDNTKAAVAGFLRNDTENRSVRYFWNEENQKVAKTRNRGVQEASGSYIAFLDADDFWESSKLEKQLQCLEENPSAAFCFTGRELIDADGNSMQKVIPVPREVAFSDMLKTNFVTCSSVLLKKETALAYPMDHDEYCEDYICWMRILKEGQKAIGINEPLVKYRMLSGSKSNDKKKAARNHYQSLRILGLGPVTALFHMISYAYHGVKKYS